MGIYGFYGKLNRYRQIVEVLTHHQLGYLVDLLGLSRFSRTSRQHMAGPADEKVPDKWARSRIVLEELGGTFIKMGQILSTRGDLLPGDLVGELEKLQDQVPSFSFEEVRKTLERELKGDLDELFTEIDEIPLASASISQVHRAVLKQGEQAALKVQRPGIKKSIQTDTEILLDAARFLERRKLFKGRYNFVPLAQEIKDSLEDETDYLREAHNAERFRRNFADDPTVYVPAIYWGFTTSRVLCMELIRGTKILNIDELREKGLDPAHIARAGAAAYFRQILLHGFFHADPHPGNLFITDDGKVAFVDFGLVGIIDIDTRNKLGDLFIAVIKGSIDSMIDALLSLGTIPALVDRIRLKKDLADAYSRYSVLPLKDINISAVMKEMTDLMFKYQVRILPDFLLMIKTVTMLESIGRQLDPDFNMIAVAEPFARDLMRERMMSHWWLSDSLKALRNLFDSTNEMVKQISGTGKALEKGEIKVRNEHTGLQHLVNRLCFTIIVASIILGSAWLTAAGTYPFFGLIGFALATFLGTWLLISVARSGRL